MSDKIMDFVSNGILNNSKLVAIVIVIVALVAIIGAAGQFAIEIVSKFKFLVGFALLAALVVGAIAFLK